MLLQIRTVDEVHHPPACRCLVFNSKKDRAVGDSMLLSCIAAAKQYAGDDVRD